MSAKATTWRQQSRWECSIEATVVTPDGEHACMVTDISDRGAGLWCPEANRLTVDAEASLRLPDRGEVRVKIRHVAGSVVGLAFLEPVAPAAEPRSADGAARAPEQVARGRGSRPR